MLQKYIPVLLMVIGMIVFVSATEPPCDGEPYSGLNNCLDHKGKFLFEGTFCYENVEYDQAGVPQADCIKQGYDFKTKEECEEKCKEHIVKYE